MKKIKIIELYVNEIKKNEVIKLFQKWLSIEWTKRTSKSIFLSNVHMCMEVKDNPNYSVIINNADLVLPDGKPIYIGQRLLGAYNSEHFRGKDLMMKVCDFSEKKGFSIGLFGSTNKVLINLKLNLISKFPQLKIKFIESPPFRKFNSKENQNYINEINRLQIDILFVSLGCPKQEVLINEYMGQTNSIMIGVGAAFDFISGSKKDAPLLMQKVGLEWFYRFLSEPKRLWKRYLKHNPRFIYYFILQYFGIIRR